MPESFLFNHHIIACIQTQCHWKLASRQHWQETLSVRWFFRKHYYPTHQLRRWNQSGPSIIVEALREIGSPIFLLRKLFKTSFQFERKLFTKLVFAARILCAVKSILIILNLLFRENFSISYFCRRRMGDKCLLYQHHFQPTGIWLNVFLLFFFIFTKMLKKR